MGELEELLGDMGAKQWVKNKFVAKLRDFHKGGRKDVDTFLAEFNKELYEDFKAMTNEVVDEVIKKASVMLAETDKNMEPGL